MTIEDNDGYKFYRDVLKCPKFIVAPMVEQSDLPFRVLCKRYGAHLGYTPMIHTENFISNHKLRDELLYGCCSDRPLIAQFCCNNVEKFLKAVELSKDYVDAIDINLGCPQHIARRGHYGAFLQDEWDLISEMIKQATNKFKIPITCKIRVFDDEQKTIDYAKMIEKSGCSLLTVHGRTREMKGQFTGLADWSIIKRIKEELKIPVFANGNIQSMKHVNDCLEFTKCDGVMSAEGLLYNPALFKSIHVPSWTIIDEYLEICKSFDDLRQLLSKSVGLEDFQNFSNELRRRFEKEENQIVEQTTYLPLPHYLTQPYYRPECKQIRETGQNKPEFAKPSIPKDSELKKDDSKEATKRKLSVKEKKEAKRAKLSICVKCFNPGGQSCDHSMCKPCCKGKCIGSKEFSCSAHRINNWEKHKKAQSGNNKEIEKSTDS